jgi:hypothetical protein
MGSVFLIQTSRRKGLAIDRDRKGTVEQLSLSAQSEGRQQGRLLD